MEVDYILPEITVARETVLIQMRILAAPTDQMIIQYTFAMTIGNAVAENVVEQINAATPAKSLILNSHAYNLQRVLTAPTMIAVVRNALPADSALL